MCRHTSETQLDPREGSPFVRFRCNECGRIRGSYFTKEAMAGVAQKSCLCGQTATKFCEIPRFFGICGQPLCDDCTHCT